MINRTSKTSKEWREKWEFFWRRYYSLSDRVYNDRREKKKITLSPRERYWEAFKETFPERFTSYYAKEYVTNYIPPQPEPDYTSLEERAKMGQH